jgi:2-iminobutanoate/2-iminopropanoate deaminase
MSNSEGRQVISTPKAPKAIGPYSQAIRTGNFVFSSGQLGLDPQTMEIVPGGIDAQTRQVLINLKYVLDAAGSDLGQVIKTTVFLTDMANFTSMNAIYNEHFLENPPARSTVAVAGLPKGGLVEIEVVALLK